MSEQSIGINSKPVGFVLYNSYGKRRTAEAVADKLRAAGHDTALREDKHGNHLVYWRENESQQRPIRSE